MTPELAIALTRQAIWIALLISAPILGLGLLVGLLISIFQAVTSIQEMTLTFIPKLLVGAIAIFTFGPWALRILMNFTAHLIQSIPQLAQ
jgi:flagellar biosynthetic protein FliQ